MESIESNTTNWPELHYCEQCQRPFNPSAWPCPCCDDDADVTRNPLDDCSEYYCHACNVAFDRLGPDFDPELVAENELTTDVDNSPVQLVIETNVRSDQLRTEIQVTVRNAGATSVVTRGRDSIAIQQRVGQQDWMTLYGNPAAYTPDERVDLEPDDTLSWDLSIHPRGLDVSDIFTRCRQLLPGEFRFIYWGLEEIDAVVATRFSVDFDHEQE